MSRATFQIWASDADACAYLEVLADDAAGTLIRREAPKLSLECATRASGNPKTPHSDYLKSEGSETIQNLAE
jgi:hypothetical protein